MSSVLDGFYHHFGVLDTLFVSLGLNHNADDGLGAALTEKNSSLVVQQFFNVFNFFFYVFVSNYRGLVFYADVLKILRIELYWLCKL